MGATIAASDWPSTISIRPGGDALAGRAGVAALTIPQSSTLANGALLVTRQRPESQVFALDVAIRAGARYEQPETASVTRFLERALLAGTDRWPTRDRLLRAISARGGELGVTAGREIVEVRIAIGLDDLELALAILGDVLTAARFDPATLEDERGVILQQLAERQDDPENLAADLLFDTVFAGHPLANRPTGTVEGVGRLAVETPRAYWNARLVGPNVLVGIVSGLDHDAAVERLGPAFDGLPSGPPTPLNRRPVPPNPTQSLTIQAGQEQAHVFVGLPIPGVTAPDRAALRVANSIVGRSSGRLYSEIRDRRGLAYSTYSSVAQYSDGGILYAYAGTDPENLDEVRAVLIAELATLRDGPLEAGELDDARGNEVGGRILGRETSQEEATVLARDAVYGLPPAEEQDDRLRAVTVADVRLAARTYFDPARMTTVVARPGVSDPDEDLA